MLYVFHYLRYKEDDKQTLRRRRTHSVASVRCQTRVAIKEQSTSHFLILNYIFTNFIYFTHFKFKHFFSTYFLFQAHTLYIYLNYIYILLPFRKVNNSSLCNKKQFPDHIHITSLTDG